MDLGNLKFNLIPKQKKEHAKHAPFFQVMQISTLSLQAEANNAFTKADKNFRPVIGYLDSRI